MRIEPLGLQNCTIDQFLVFMDKIHPGGGAHYLDFFKKSDQTYTDLLGMVQIGTDLNPNPLLNEERLKVWVTFFGVFLGNLLIGIGGCKYVPPGIHIRVKERSNMILPKSAHQFFSNKPAGQDGLHLIELPGYLEIGPTAIDSEHRGQGYFSALHQTRLRFLLSVSQASSLYPDSLLVGTTGSLRQELDLLYQQTDRLISFIPRNNGGQSILSDTIWNNIGNMRKESMASGILAKRMNLEQIGYKKTNGGPVWWGSLQEAHQQIF